MKHSVHIKLINELFRDTADIGVIREQINCSNLDYNGITSHFSSPLIMNASIAILVLSGTASVCINYKSYAVKAEIAILLSSSHLFHFDSCSRDFRCTCLIVSKEFMLEMDSTDMIYKRIKYGVKLYNAPVIQLGVANATLLLDRISAIDKAIDASDHYYYKEMILNTLFAFYLDLSNVIERQTEMCNEGNLTRYESIIKSFIELLASYYREEHKVDFYASRLNISAHYLTSIVKRITGQTVSNFIFEMLYSEARTLLDSSKLSIQEIATMLNFADQSSFGKFFKRKAGISPVDYRKK